MEDNRTIEEEEIVHENPVAFELKDPLGKILSIIGLIAMVGMLALSNPPV